MNLKKAKMLRTLVNQMVEKGIVKGDHTRYGTIGNNTTTRVLDPMCAKGIYRRMKKYGPVPVLQGRA